MQDAPPTWHDSSPALAKTVLIVENDADIADFLTIFLRETTPYQVIQVTDAFAALKMVQTITPQLILLDYFLPGMSGLAFLDLLRASKGVERIPVIFMSAALPEGIEKRQQVQARADLIFLEKPFEPDALLTLMRHLLEEES
ncbi:MAG TPA: response regulator [Ktedonobacteraceae bacterium]|nr:response regulator [Ktedonobacteraceae bacterium]